MSERLVITGVSAICALGCERDEIVAAMREGRECISAKPAPDWTGRETMTGAWVRDFKPAPVIPPMKARRMERSSQMAIVAADAALKQAQWDFEQNASDALGIFLGSGFCGTHSSLSIVHTLFSQGAEEVSAAAFPNTVPNAPAGLIAIHFGLEGPSATLLQTGTTSEAALLFGREQLAAGQCRAALWGGVDELTEYLWFGWQRLGWIDEAESRNDFGRPLHPDSRGFQAGESAAMIVVEEESAARARGVQTLATIGVAATGAVEADPWGYPEPEQADRIADFFAAALESCSGSSDLVLGCGNGHRALDALEAKVLERVAGGAPVWYAKASIGESMASTAVRVALGVWLMQEGFVPANGWLRDARIETSLNVARDPAPRSIGRVLIPTISAGGTIACIVLERTPRS